jgi:hypothetical protein
MASFFGSVAKEVGEGFQENAANKREDKDRADTRAHQLQLEKQRQKFETGLIDRRMSADDKRAQRTIEANRILQGDQQAFTTGLEQNRQGFEMEKTQLQEASDMWQTAMGLYAKSKSTTSMSGSGWDIKFEEKDTLDPETGQMVTRRSANIFREGMEPMELKDGQLLRVGQTEMPEPFVSEDMKKRAEGDLANGDLTPEEFQQRFKYLPADYVFDKVSSDDKGFENWTKTNGITLPAFGSMGGGDSDGLNFTGGYAEGGPTSEASRRLRELEEEQGYNTATRAQIDDHVRMRRDDAGKGEYPDGVEPGDMGSPYQGDFTGEVSQWGSGVLGEGQRLDTGGQLEAPPQASADAGGQLDPSVMEALTDGQVGGQRSGNELDDAGAAEIARLISAASTQRAQGAESTEALSEVQDPLGAFKEVGQILGTPFRKPETPRHPVMPKAE